MRPSSTCDTAHVAIGYPTDDPVLLLDSSTSLFDWCENTAVRLKTVQLLHRAIIYSNLTVSPFQILPYTTC